MIWLPSRDLVVSSNNNALLQQGAQTQVYQSEFVSACDVSNSCNCYPTQNILETPCTRNSLQKYQQNSF
uniref:Uncharacterized protein n=1 Tax=Triticum urartu TaxID=4572 RepID=A0A8R7Q577_TRIUA